MEEGRRKIRYFLFCVVLAAVLMGIFYYFTEIYQTTDISDGTLVHLVLDHEVA